MRFYNQRVLPHLLHLTMRQSTFAPYRQRTLAAAAGQVLEVGVGSGINLPLYTSRVTQFVGIDPSRSLLNIAREHWPRSLARVALLEASAEAIPLRTMSVDTIVTTWTLCSIPNVRTALAEMQRVLKPSGQLLFVEHGRAPDERVMRWQDRLTPVWRRIAGGCHLNRPVQKLLEDAGFRFESIETGYMRGPKPMTFIYEGRARKQ